MRHSPLRTSPALRESAAGARRYLAEDGNTTPAARGAAILEQSPDISLAFGYETACATAVAKLTRAPNTMKFARFMVTTGMLKSAPESWRDYFFPEIHSADGS
jgi:NitT/TauT family transport system substrate-binding protein